MLETRGQVKEQPKFDLQIANYIALKRVLVSLF